MSRPYSPIGLLKNDSNPENYTRLMELHYAQCSLV